MREPARPARPGHDRAVGWPPTVNGELVEERMMRISKAFKDVNARATDYGLTECGEG